MNLLLPVLIVLSSLNAWCQVNNPKQFDGYTNSRAPLKQNPFLELPLGAIKPHGWLKEMLIRQKNGSTGY